MLPKKILVVRNDKIGDFMLAWPSFAMLKKSLPTSRIVALVPEYTKPLALLCPFIDEIIVDPEVEFGVNGWQFFEQTVKDYCFDALLTLFSTTRIGRLGKRVKIPYRLAPATKFAQIYYNDRLVQRRSRSLKPEFEYNLDLVRCFLDRYKVIHKVSSVPYLKFPVAEQEQMRHDFVDRYAIIPQHRLVFLHIGSDGSANNLSLEQYVNFVGQLKIRDAVLILTAGPGEIAMVQKMCEMLYKQRIEHRIYESTEGIVSFVRHLSLADLFIAGSTGPLHIAGALDVPTVGFYPSKRSSTCLRWRTLNGEGNYLAFSPPSSNRTATDMSLINISKAAAATNNFMQCLQGK